MIFYVILYSQISSVTASDTTSAQPQPQQPEELPKCSVEATDFLDAIGRFDIYNCSVLIIIQMQVRC